MKFYTPVTSEVLNPCDKDEILYPCDKWSYKPLW